jgi:hypothetical protein
MSVENQRSPMTSKRGSSEISVSSAKVGPAKKSGLKNARTHAMRSFFFWASEVGKKGCLMSAREEGCLYRHFFAPIDGFFFQPSSDQRYTKNGVTLTLVYPCSPSLTGHGVPEGPTGDGRALWRRGHQVRASLDHVHGLGLCLSKCCLVTLGILRCAIRMTSHAANAIGIFPVGFDTSGQDEH